MSPTDFAAEELAAWSAALDDLYEAERQAETARRARDVPGFFKWLKGVDDARVRAACLLAAAVAKKRAAGG